MATFPLECLPNELLHSTFHHLCPSDRFALSTVSRRFRKLIDNVGYLTTDAAEIHIDFDDQVLMVLWKDTTWISMFVNGELKSNRRLFAEKGRSLLKHFSSPRRCVVRNVGNTWNKLIGSYLARMEREFTEIEIPYLRIVVPSDASSFIRQLLKMRELNVDRLILCAIGEEKELVLLPDVFDHLVRNCIQCHVNYYIPLETICQLNVTRGRASLSAAESVSLIKKFMNGTFSMKASRCWFAIKGDVQLFLEEALRHAYLDRASEYFLPQILQPDGHEYYAWVSRKGVIEIYKKDRV